MATAPWATHDSNRRHHPHRTRRSRRSERGSHLELHRVFRASLSGRAREPWSPADEPQMVEDRREKLRAIAQTGLAFSEDRFDRQRPERVRDLAAAMLAQGSAGRPPPPSSASCSTDKVSGPRHTQSRRAARRLHRRPRAAGARNQRRQVDPARRLGGRQSDGRRVCGTGNRRRIGVRGQGAQARGRPRLPEKHLAASRHLDSIYKIFFISMNHQWSPAPAMRLAKWHSSRAMPCRRYPSDEPRPRR